MSNTASQGMLMGLSSTHSLPTITFCCLVLRHHMMLRGLLWPTGISESVVPLHSPRSSAMWARATLAVSGPCRYWLSTFQPHRLGLEGRTIHPDGGILDLAWAPGDTKFASASEDSTVCVWDLHTCKLQTRIEAHAGDCTSVHWHPTTSLLSSCSRDTLVRSLSPLQPSAWHNR